MAVRNIRLTVKMFNEICFFVYSMTMIMMKRPHKIENNTAFILKEV